VNGSNAADAKALDAAIREFAAAMATVRPLVGDHMVSGEVLQQIDRVRDALQAGGMTEQDVDAVPGLEPVGVFPGTEPLDRAPLSGAELAWLAEKLGAVVPSDPNKR